MIGRCFKVLSVKGKPPPALCGAAAQRRHSFLVLEVSRSYTIMHHGRCNSSGREIGSSQRLRIRTHNPSKRANADPRLRMRGHCNQLKASYSAGDNVPYRFIMCLIDFTKIKSRFVPYMGCSADGSVKIGDCLFWLYCCQHTDRSGCIVASTLIILAELLPAH